MAGFPTKIFREPIVHFLVVGLVLFCVNNLLDEEDTRDSAVIVVDRESLTRFIQFRTQSFTDGADEKLNNLSPNALDDVVRQYIQEEALYRKAISYGMGADDYVIKRRMVQKMEFLAEGTGSAPTTPAEEDLIGFYEQNKKGYELPAAISFTHVFHSSERHKAQVASLAAETLQQLNAAAVQFEEAAQYGDRFPYMLNYSERSQEEIEGHFGREMAEALFDLPLEPAIWQGPLQSAFGLHAVLLVNKIPAHVPPFSEIRNRVVADFQRHRGAERKQRAIEELIADFDIRISPEFQNVIEP